MMDPSLQQLLKQVGRINGLANELRESFNEVVQLAEKHPAMAATLSRKTLSHMIENVYRRELNEPGSKPLDSLLTEGKSKGIFPEKIYGYAQSVKVIGNVGAHKMDEKIFTADVVRSLDSLLPILEWYAGVMRPVSTDLPPASPPPPSSYTNGAIRDSRPPIRIATRPAAPSRPTGSGQFAPASAGSPRSGTGMKPPSTVVSRTSTLVDPLCWSAIGALAGGAVGGNLGLLGGSLLFDLGVEAAEGRSAVMGMVAIFVALIGVGAGSIASSIPLPIWPRDLNRWRSVLAGVVAAWLSLEIIGRIELTMGSRSGSFTIAWDMAGGLIGLIVGLTALSPTHRILKLATGCVTGGCLLALQGLFLSQPWQMITCLLSGAIAGVAAGALTDALIKGHQDRARWILLTIVIWGLIEAGAGEVALLMVQVVLGAVGAGLGMVLRSPGIQRALTKP